MQCPKCYNVITELSTQCLHCNYSYEKEIYERLTIYFEMKKEFTHLHSVVKNDVWASMQKISESLANYERLIDTDLKNMSVVIKDGEVTESMPAVKSVSEINVEKKPEAPAQIRQEKIPVKETPKPKRVHEEESSAFEVRLGQKWLLIIGIVTMIFGIGYFLKYSFEQGWVGPAGRVAMAYFWGIALLVAGNGFRTKKFETFGLYLIGGGIATLYFSTFAAFQIYHLFSQIPSFSIMVLITVLASVLSIVYDNKWLSVLGIIGGFMTPVLLSTGQDNQIALMTYMAILNIGLLSIAFYKRWGLLNILGFIFTYLLFTTWFGSHYTETKFWPTIIFLNIFYLIYCLIPFAYYFSRIDDERTEEFLIITPNSFIAFGYSYFMIREYFSLEWVSVISVLYSVLFLLMASYLFKKDKHNQNAFVILLAKSALFLIITIPIIFSKHWITIFWAAQAITLLWAGIKLDKKSLILSAYLLITITLGKFLLYDYISVFRFNPAFFSIANSYTYMITERYITSAFLLALLYVFARMAKRMSLQHLSTSRTSDSEDAPAIFALWGGLLFIVLNIETASFFHDYLPAARFAAISVLWALFSVILMIKGFKDNNSLIRKVSLVLFSITLLKVFSFDMSNISTPYRIISFIILGLILVMTSYLYHKYKDKIIDAIGAAEKTGVK